MISKNRQVYNALQAMKFTWIIHTAHAKNKEINTHTHTEKYTHARRTVTIPVGVSAIFRGNPEHAFRANDHPGLAVLQGPAAPRDELGAKQRVVAAALELAVGHPVKATVRANRADEHLHATNMATIESNTSSSKVQIRVD